METQNKAVRSELLNTATKSEQPTVFMRVATAMEYQTKLWIGGSSSELENNFGALIKVGQY
jgi:hypothetical protein